MLARSLSLRVMSALVALAAASGCSLADGFGDPAGGGSNDGGGTGQPAPTEVGYEETDPGNDPPRLGGGSAGTDSCDNGVRFEIAPNATHGRVSAAFAVAALEAGTWPNINRSLLRHDEFLAYFARSETPEPFARVRTTDEGERLDVFVRAADEDRPTHLILVVDTSTSMRNDLPLAGAIVSGLATAVADNGADYLTVVEWGSAPRVFTTDAGDSTVPASKAAQLGNAFDDYASSVLTKAQLGPGGSLGPAQGAVDAAIEAGPETPHIVVLTDGGVEADGDAFAAIESWATKRSAVISFIEIAGASSTGDKAQPRSFHREQLASMATAGGGLTHFVTDETLHTLLEDFEGSFRIGRRNVLPRYEMAGITSLLDSSDVDFAAGEIGSGSLPRWSGRGRHVFTSVGVTTCGVQPFSGIVYLDDVPTAVEVGDPQDVRVARLAQIDQLFGILRSDCDAALPLIAAFDEIAGAETDLRELVDKAAAICEPTP